MTEKFDVAAWRKQAETALEALISTREDTQKELDDLDTEISELSSALGVEDSTGKRARLRGPILELLALNDEPVMMVAIASTLAIDGVTEDKVLKAVRRTVRDCDTVEYANEANNSVILHK